MTPATAALDSEAIVAPAAPLDLESARLRFGDAYELVVFDRLAADEQAAFAELAADPDHYGVLRPLAAAGGHSYRAVDRDTALLLLTLSEPGPLPFFAHGADAADGIAALLLDDVLEVERDGEFVSGAAAAALLAPDVRRAATPGHPLARLADEALLSAAALCSDEADRLAGFLYGYNRLPVTAGWERRVGAGDPPLGFLGFAAGSPARRRLEAAWAVSGPGDDGAGWVKLSPRRRASSATGDATYKLYVSPRAEELPRCFAALVEVLGGGANGSPAVAFKVGADAAGLLRPDKLVVYFAGLEPLLAVARELEERLAGTPAQGVPFSAPIDAEGLLSWGVDPPASARPLSWHGPESWRTWVVDRLARALARAAGEAPEAAHRFALTRVEREGVDVERWLPGAGLFRID